MHPQYPKESQMSRLILTLVLTSALVSSVLSVAHTQTKGKSLTERLGFTATDVLLIINGDDTGMCHAANTATIKALETGLMTSATIMVPCPWFPEIAAYAKAHPNLDFGVHLTHTSEWTRYRWGPVCDRSKVPGLVDPEGYLWNDEKDVFKHATPDEAETEARAQIKRALAFGIDATHIDSHMGGMQYDIRFHDRYAKLAREFDLPLRMGPQALYAMLGQPDYRDKLAAQGLVFPDYLVLTEERKPGETQKQYWMRVIRTLKPGVNELYIHASDLSPEGQATSNTWRERAADAEVFTSDADMRALLDELHIKRIGYRALRDLQRKERAASGGPK
jgi:chitin disaccharide deacetylase